MPILVNPSPKYKKSFLQAAKELKDSSYRGFPYIEPEESFEDYLNRLKRLASGEELIKQGVPAVVFWLVEDNEFIGRLSIKPVTNQYLESSICQIGYMIRPSKRRQGYGKLILKLGLKEAKKMGLKKVSISCKQDNIASKRIIESVKARFVNTYKYKKDKDYIMRRYIIDLS